MLKKICNSLLSFPIRRLKYLMVVFALCPFFLLPTNLAHATTTTTKNTTPDTTQQMIALLPSNYQPLVKEGADGSFTVKTNGLNQAQVNQAIVTALKKAPSARRAASGLSPNVSDCPASNSGAGNDGLNATIYSSLNTWGCNQDVTMSGTTYAYNAMSVPANIVLKSQVVLNGVAASISVGVGGPSFGFSGSGGGVANYSGTFTGTDNCGHSYGSLNGWSAFPWSVDQNDNATMRVGNQDYSPNDKVTIILPW